MLLFSATINRRAGNSLIKIPHLTMTNIILFWNGLSFGGQRSQEIYALLGHLQKLNDFHLLICSVIQFNTNSSDQATINLLGSPLCFHCDRKNEHFHCCSSHVLIFFNINYKFHLFLIFVQTTSNNIQAIVESRIEKRTKAEFVPVGGKRLLCFLDDLNMPAQDLFGSQPPLELLRLWIDYGFWYDRQKQTQMFIKVREEITLGIQGRFSLFSLRFLHKCLFLQVSDEL